MKHLWQVGQRKLAFDSLSQFVITQSKSAYVDEDDGDGDKLLARCAYYSDTIIISIPCLE